MLVFLHDYINTKIGAVVGVTKIPLKFPLLFTGFSGGRVRMNCKMMSWASFLSLGGNSPSTIILFNFGPFLMSLINTSYGESSYSTGVFV